MSLSAQDLADLHQIITGATSSPTPDSQSPGFLSRLGMGLANVPTQAVHDIGQGAVSLVNSGLPEESQFPKVPTFNPYTVPQARSIADQVADVIPGIASVAASIAIPEMGIARFLQGAGMEAGAAKLAAAGAGWGLSGSQESPIEGVAQAGQGMAFQALGAAPMRVRAPMAAGLGLATGAYYANKDGLNEGLAMGGANALMGLIGHGAKVEAPVANVEARTIPKTPAELAAEAVAGVPQAGNMSSGLIDSMLGINQPSKWAAESAGAMKAAGSFVDNSPIARDSAAFIAGTPNPDLVPRSAQESAQAMIDAGVIPQTVSKSANESAQAILEHHYGSPEALPSGVEHLDLSLDPRYHKEKFELTNGLNRANEVLATNPNHPKAAEYQKYADYATRRLQTLENYRKETLPMTDADLQPLQRYVPADAKSAEEAAGIIGADPGRPMPPFSLDNPNPAPITPDKANTLGDLNNALGMIQSTGKPIGRTVEGTKLYSGIPDPSILTTLSGQDLIAGGAGAAVERGRVLCAAGVAGGL